MDGLSRLSISSDSSSERSIHQATRNTLSPSERAAFLELKRLCASNNVYWKSNGRVGGQITAQCNDDVTLLRFLRARNYVPCAAFKQYTATVTWRQQLKLDAMYTNADIPHFEAMRRLLPQWTGRRSCTGLPIYAYRVSAIQQCDLVSTAKSDPSLSTVFLTGEYAEQFVQPLCGRLNGGNAAVAHAMHIIDLKGVGVKHLWSLRSYLQKLGATATAHYPEAVEKIFIIGAPSFFPTLYSFITKLFDANLTSKISVLTPSNAFSTLTRYIHPDDLPQFAGGNQEWDYGCHPDLDAEARVMVGFALAEEWVEGPLKFMESEDGGEILAVGTGGKAIREKIIVRVVGKGGLSDSEEE
ncbi:MAG: hypothetical protein MMC33_008514 [Icmadophila ericetorum]|nr:hypothetical protein [Icmadophila ericetorum]